MSRHRPGIPTFLLGTSLATLSLGTPLLASGAPHGTDSAPGPHLSLLQSFQQQETMHPQAAVPPDDGPQAGPPPASAAYRRSVDLALGPDDLQLSYRELSLREDGYWSIEGILNEDSDWAVVGKVTRLGQLVGYPIRFGVGIGAYATVFDETDSDAYAVALLGLVQYDLPTLQPVTATLEVSFAPDITTFADADSLLDVQVRVETAIGAGASAFVGYRLLDVDTGIDDELVQSLNIGVRLGV